MFKVNYPRFFAGRSLLARRVSVSKGQMPCLLARELLGVLPRVDLLNLLVIESDRADSEFLKTRRIDHGHIPRIQTGSI